jgi:twitching motility two-component system response regulator PilG
MAYQKDTYSVEVLGFTDTEQTVLASVFGLSSRRIPKFLRHTQADTPPDIFLADANDPAAIKRLSERNASRQIPAILVGDSNCGTDWPVMPRPIRWMKLFQAFDAAIAAPSAGMPAKSAETDKVAMASPVPPPLQMNTAANVKPTARAGGISTEMPVTRPAPAVGERSGALQAKSPEADWVLVVDDNLTVREFMKNKLAAFNFNVDFAENGEQAIGFTGQKHYTCIFLDVIMPGIDGYQVCKLIKSNRTAQKTAVVMLTSKDSPFDKIRGSMSGCDAYLTKPVDEERLLETIVKFLPTRN